jgi:hypothetical protein
MRLNKKCLFVQEVNLIVKTLIKKHHERDVFSWNATLTACVCEDGVGRGFAGKFWSNA